MKKGIYASIIALSLVFTANAYSAQGMYVSVDAGLAMPDDVDLDSPDFPGIKFTFELDSGAAFSGAIGYRIQNFRIEGEVGYQKNDFDNVEISGSIVRREFLGRSFPMTGDLNTLSFLANAYYDFPTGTKFTPFITAGFGVVQVELNDFSIVGLGIESFSDDDSFLGGQVGAGVSYAINDMLDIELKYRYFMVEDLDFEDGFTADGPTSHNVYLGMRFNF